MILKVFFNENNSVILELCLIEGIIYRDCFCAIMKYHCPPSLYKSPQFDMISDSHVSCPLANINVLPYDDIYGFHYFLQHSIDFEICGTNMNCPSRLCRYSCLSNKRRPAQWFRIQLGSCLRAKEVKIFLLSQLKVSFLENVRIMTFQWIINVMATVMLSIFVSRH